MNESPSSPLPENSPPVDALARLVNREEVLQICYWYQGEGFGDRYDAAVLRPFLNCDGPTIDIALRELEAMAALEREDGRYRFTEQGRHEAGRLFAEGFADFQKQGHGECDAGCCDGDDHSKCGEECPLH
ncbi:MAG: hypothetical protein ABIO71_09085 [Caldimonas sp.]